MLGRMSTNDTDTPARRFACIPSAVLASHESAALLAAKLEPTEHVAITVGIGQMQLGLAVDPATGKAAWIVQAVATLEGDALNVKQSAVLDPNGNATSRALATAVPIGGTVRLVVRKDALHEDLQAAVAEAPRINLASFMPTT